jgi:ADP-ribose pyrophosphatase YjhB (NUDIX family)
VTRDLARPVAVALIRRGNAVLVSDVPDPVKGVVGWRPPGGTIEFGERGSDTVVREIREELALEVINAEYLGTLENIFTYLGARAHELIRVYAARFANPRSYDRERFDCVEANGSRFTCVWKPVTDFGTGAPLYPDGLLELIHEREERVGDGGEPRGV